MTRRDRTIGALATLALLSVGCGGGAATVTTTPAPRDAVGDGQVSLFSDTVVEVVLHADGVAEVLRVRGPELDGVALELMVEGRPNYHLNLPPIDGLDGFAGRFGPRLPEGYQGARLHAVRGPRYAAAPFPPPEPLPAPPEELGPGYVTLRVADEPMLLRVGNRINDSVGVKLRPLTPWSDADEPEAAVVVLEGRVPVPLTWDERAGLYRGETSGLTFDGGAVEARLLRRSRWRRGRAWLATPGGAEALDDPIDVQLPAPELGGSLPSRIEVTEEE